MKKKQENGVGEPGQFKITPVAGFTPTAYTPTESPATKKVKTLKRNLTQGHSAEEKAVDKNAKAPSKGVNK